MSYSVRAMGRGRLLWVPSTYPTRVVRRGRDPDLLVRSEITPQRPTYFPSPLLLYIMIPMWIMSSGSHPNLSHPGPRTSWGLLHLLHPVSCIRAG